MFACMMPLSDLISICTIFIFIAALTYDQSLIDVINILHISK